MFYTNKKRPCKYTNIHANIQADIQYKHLNNNLNIQQVSIKNSERHAKQFLFIS